MNIREIEAVKKALKTLNSPGEIQRVYLRYPDIVKKVLDYRLGIDTYAKCMKVLHPEKCIASNQTELEGLIKKTCDNFFNNLNSESHFRADLVILVELNDKNFQDCLNTKQIGPEYLPYCQSAYKTANMRQLIKNACKLTDEAQRIEFINALNNYEKIFNNCYNGHYLSNNEMTKVEQALKHKSKENLTKIYQDERNTMTTLLVYISQMQKPKDLVNNLMYLRNINSDLVRKCFNKLDENTKKIYKKAIADCKRQMEDQNKNHSKEFSK